MQNEQASVKIHHGNFVFEALGPVSFVQEMLEFYKSSSEYTEMPGLNAPKVGVTGIQKKKTSNQNQDLVSTGKVKSKKPLKSSSSTPLVAVDTKAEGSTPSLKDFVAEKVGDPKNISAQKLGVVFIYYLTRFKNMGGVNAGHLRFCFKEVGARTPTNIKKVINNMVSRDGYIERTENVGDYNVNIAGENFVEIDLPAAA